MDCQRIENTTQANLGIISEQLFIGNMQVIANYPPALQRAIYYICNHYTDPVALSDVADQAFISSSHLSYLFRQCLNLRFKNLLSELRIRHAMMLIEKNPAAMITEVSLYSGFFDLSHFEKMFRRYTAMAPRTYRNNVRLRLTANKNEVAKELEVI